MSVRPVKLPILVYHTLDEYASRISTRPDWFERQVAWLAEHGWQSVRLTEIAAAFRAGRPLPGKSVALTFDDAMPSVLEVAQPILERYGLSATTFVVTGQVGQRPEWSRLPEIYRRTPLLSRQGLRDLADAGWEIQPHSHNHPVLPHLSLDAQVDQIRRSRDLVREWFGAPGDVLAYPFGQVDERTREAMARCEMAAGVTLRFSAYLDPASPYLWPRVGSAWLKDSRLRQALALNGMLEYYVRAKQRIRGDRSRHFVEITEETTQGLPSAGEPGGPRASTH